MKSLDLFTGIGGFALASKWLGIETTQFAEIDSYCQKVLNKNFPNIPIYSDIKTYEPIIGAFDIVTGGSPCQDLSIAGKQKGIIDGERSSLWFEQLRVYKQSGATFLVWENVMGAFRNGFREVLRSLSESGYDAEWQVISAAALGAPHLRERIFLVAYPSSLQFSGQPCSWSDQIGYQIEIASTYANDSRSRDWFMRNESKQPNSINSHRSNYWSSFEPPVCGVAHGLPRRLDRLKALGNAVTPQQASIPLMRVLYLNSLIQK